MATNTNYSAQGSITIKRLRNGESYFITFNCTQPLYQGIDEVSKSVVPNWKNDASTRPTITPVITDSAGKAVAIKSGSVEWKYKGVGIALATSADASGFYAEATSSSVPASRFNVNKATGALKIVDNLASASETSHVTLTFSCKITVNNVDYSLSKTIDVQIQTVGTNGYVGFITAGTQQLSSAAGNNSTTLRLKLYCGSNPVSSYGYKIVKQDGTVIKDLTASTSAEATHDITRANVNGMETFIAEFYESATTGAKLLYRAGVQIIDVSDSYQIQLGITSTNTEVSVGQNVVVGAKLMNITTGKEVGSTGTLAWTLKIIDPQTLDVVKDGGGNAIAGSSSSTNSITVTTAHTDRNGKQTDVEVYASATFTNPVDKN